MKFITTLASGSLIAGVASMSGAGPIPQPSEPVEIMIDSTVVDPVEEAHHVSETLSEMEEDPEQPVLTFFEPRYLEYPVSALTTVSTEYPLPPGMYLELITTVLDL